MDQLNGLIPAGTFVFIIAALNLVPIRRIDITAETVSDY
jgi:hypothetical protein